jgi:hypothetical protein
LALKRSQSTTTYSHSFPLEGVFIWIINRRRPINETILHPGCRPLIGSLAMPSRSTSGPNLPSGWIRNASVKGTYRKYIDICSVVPAAGLLLIDVVHPRQSKSLSYVHTYHTPSTSREIQSHFEYSILRYSRDRTGGRM